MSGDHNGKITFFNHLGSSLIDYALVDRMMFEKVKDFMVLDFNEWSDHSPILLTLSMFENYNDTLNIDTTAEPGLKLVWNNDYMEEMKLELNKMEGQLYDTILNIENGNEYIDDCVHKFTELLNQVFEPFCKQYVYSIEKRTDGRQNKPWFDDNCKTKYKIYKNNLKLFNSSRNHINRCNLVQSKKEYKNYSQKMKSEYQRVKGDQL